MKKVIFAVGAHPDDIEIGCAGTLCSLLASGKYEVIHIIATAGEEGSLELSSNKLSKVRKSESLKSAKIIGAKKVFFLNLSDGLTHFVKKDKIRLVRLIRKYKPEIIFTHSRNDNLSDHQVIHKITAESVQIAAGPWYLAAGKNIHRVHTIYGYEVWSPISKPQMLVDITKFMSKKIAALECHKTQIKSVSYIQAIKGLAAYRGATMMCGRYAEVFEVIKTEAIA